MLHYLTNSWKKMTGMQAKPLKCMLQFCIIVQFICFLALHFCDILLLSLQVSIVSINLSLFLTAVIWNITRSSATAGKQRVSCPHGGGLGPPVYSPSAHFGCTYAYGRILMPQQTYVKHTLRWVGHSRSFKVILIGAGRNPERRVVVMCNYCRRYFWNSGRYGHGKTANSSISTTPLKFEDVPARNALEYLQMIYIARN